MDKKVRESWERVLHPQTLKTSIITASIFSMAFEMLKNSIIEKIKDFFTNGFDESGMILSPMYKGEVLSLDKKGRPLRASLTWLQHMGAIDNEDLEKFKRISDRRNMLVHEMLAFASSGVDFDVAGSFEEIVSLLRKIEIWWFENLEMAIDPETYPESIDLDQVIPGPVWSLQMLIDVALGPEEVAKKYYEHFIKNEEKV